MPLNLEETFREFAGESASGLGTDPAPAAPRAPARPAAAPAAIPAEVDEDAGEAIVSKNFKIMGDLNCHDVLRIEGYVEGNIECRTLTVCESARIKGNIRAKTVNMSGKVIGTIEAGTLTLNRPAIVAGDLVVHDQLGIEPGAGPASGSAGRPRNESYEQPGAAGAQYPGHPGRVTAPRRTPAPRHWQVEAETGGTKKPGNPYPTFGVRVSPPTRGCGPHGTGKPHPRALWFLTLQGLVVPCSPKSKPYLKT